MDYLYDKEKGVGNIKVSERESADIKLNAIVKDLAPLRETWYIPQGSLRENSVSSQGEHTSIKMFKT